MNNNLRKFLGTTAVIATSIFGTPKASADVTVDAVSAAPAITLSAEETKVSSALSPEQLPVIEAAIISIESGTLSLQDKAFYGPNRVKESLDILSNSAAENLLQFNSRKRLTAVTPESKDKLAAENLSNLTKKIRSAILETQSADILLTFAHHAGVSDKELSASTGKTSEELAAIYEATKPALIERDIYTVKRPTALQNLGKAANKLGNSAKKAVQGKSTQPTTADAPAEVDGL